MAPTGLRVFFFSQPFPSAEFGSDRHRWRAIVAITMYELHWLGYADPA